MRWIIITSNRGSDETLVDFAINLFTGFISDIAVMLRLRAGKAVGFNTTCLLYSPLFIPSVVSHRESHSEEPNIECMRDGS
jgi:hypothetical protein